MAVTMNKISERWYFGYVTSTFGEADSSPGSRNGLGTDWGTVSLSGSCGYGWTFGFAMRRGDGSGGKSYYDQYTGRYQNRLPETYQIAVYFNRHLIKESTFSELEVSVEFDLLNSEPATKLNKTSKKVPFSSANELTQIATSEQFPISGSRQHIVAITVAHPTDVPSLKPPSDRIHEALRDSLDGTDVIDTRFCLWSGRDIHGRACHPRSVFVSSKLISGFSSDLDNLVSGGDGFSEPPIVNLDSELDLVPPDKVLDPDSDFEDDGFEDKDKDEGETAMTWGSSGLLDAQPPPAGPSQSKSKNKVPDTEEEITPPLGAKNRKKVGDHYNVRFGKQIVVEEVAFRTWKALMIYLYQGVIFFSPPELADSKELAIASRASGSKGTYQCSPKSMYSLADRFGLEDLKKTAFKEITSRIKEANVAHELFSKFTSKHDEVLKMQIEFACNHFSLPISVEIWQKVEEILEGEHQHARPVLREVFKRLGPIKKQGAFWFVT